MNILQMQTKLLMYKVMSKIWGNGIDKHEEEQKQGKFYPEVWIKEYKRMKGMTKMSDLKAKEEIYINNIEVSNCKYLEQLNNFKPLCRLGLLCSRSEAMTCEDKEDCYFKQMSREKEKCEDCDVAERMRKMIWLVSNGMMSYANYTYEAMEQVYNEQVNKLAKNISKNENSDLRQLLNEIKDFANNLIKDICNNCGWNHTDNCNDDCIPYEIKENIITPIENLFEHYSEE